MRFQMRSPAFLLTAFVAIIIAASLTVFYATLSRPYVSLPTGMTVSQFDTVEGKIGTRIPLGLLALDTILPPDVTSPASLHALLEADVHKGIYFEPDDFVEDPDMLVSYAAANRFYERQQRISDMIQPGTVRVVIASADGSGPIGIETLDVDARRPLATLPSSFWLQVGCGLIVILIAAFFLALRPRNFAVWAFVYAGLAVTGAAYTAAIYSVRQFGMESQALMLLSVINHFFTMSFGIGIIGLFAVYPVRLINPAWLLIPLVALCLVANFGYRTQWLPHDLVIMQNLVALQLLIILVMIGWQYRATRSRPADRAVLLWLGLSVIFGSAAFVLLVALPVSFGHKGVVTQAISFVPLCLIYIGTAFAVSRYRLFDIGRWSYRIFFYTGVIGALLALDLVFVLGLQMSAHTSIAAASVIALFGYLPFRDYVYDRFLNRRPTDLPGLYRKTVAIAYQFGAAAKQAAWIDVLKDVLRPSHIAEGHPAAGIGIVNEGIELVVPAYPWSPPLTLGLAANGRRLFNTADIALIGELATIVGAAETDRQSYERGAKEERQRIARDLHDEVGATLLTGLHSADDTRRHESIVDALADIRQISRRLTGQDVTLERFIAQLRHESRERAGLHGRQLEWPLGSADNDESILPYSVNRSLSAILREALSNALAHGGNPIRVTAEIDADHLLVEISNPLVAHASIEPGDIMDRGQGSRNIRSRAEELGGMAKFISADGRYHARVSIPLSRDTSA